MKANHNLPLPRVHSESRIPDTARAMDGIILGDKVYELSVNTDPDVCERCALADKDGNNCRAPHWLNCNCVILKFSQSLTDKINKK